MGAAHYIDAHSFDQVSKVYVFTNKLPELGVPWRKKCQQLNPLRNQKQNHRLSSGSQAAGVNTSFSYTACGWFCFFSRPCSYALVGLVLGQQFFSSVPFFCCHYTERSFFLSGQKTISRPTATPVNTTQTCQPQVRTMPRKPLWYFMIQISTHIPLAISFTILNIVMYFSGRTVINYRKGPAQSWRPKSNWPWMI